MPKYMLIVGGADLDKRSGNPDLAPAMFEQFMAWIQRVRDAGQFVSSYKLFDQTGRRLTIRGGEVIDGPFIESKDAVGGIFIVEAGTLDEATEIARGCPGLKLQNGFIEVRMIETARPTPDSRYVETAVPAAR